MDASTTTPTETEEEMNRITLDNAARVIESQSYTAYGDHRTHDGEAARPGAVLRSYAAQDDAA